MGGYYLIVLDRGDLPHDFLELDSAQQPDGNACIASGWYDQLSNMIDTFLNATGLSMLETDGPYGGGTCYATNHPHHRDSFDSVYQQTLLQSQLYQHLRARGVYINQPDDYFSAGGQRRGMGYDEVTYSMTRREDLLTARAAMHADLYRLLPTQAWAQVPIEDYHGGGADAAFWGHADDYNMALAQYLGAGVAACYCGPLPYWDAASMDAIGYWVQFYKRYRGTIIQPVVHLRRPDGQSWDGFMHVNPRRWSTAGQPANGTVPALAMIFNPTAVALQTTVALPLYYAGVNGTTVQVLVDETTLLTLAVDRGYYAYVELNMPPRSVHSVAVW